MIVLALKLHHPDDNFVSTHPPGVSCLQNAPSWWQFWLQNCTILVTILSTSHPPGVSCLQNTPSWWQFWPDNAPCWWQLSSKLHPPGAVLSLYRPSSDVGINLFQRLVVMEGYKSQQSELAGFIFHIIVIQFLAYSCLYTSTWQNILSHPCPSDNEFPWQVTSFHIKRC